MSTHANGAGAHSPIGVFERYLSLWIALCIAAGVGLGVTLPAAFQFIAGIEYASVNLVVAVLIWVMIYPMMVQVDFTAVNDGPKKLPVRSAPCWQWTSTGWFLGSDTIFRNRTTS